MLFLTVLVLLVGVVSTLNLFFTVRTTRLLTARPAPAGEPGVPQLFAPVGEVIGPLGAVTADGTVRHSAVLSSGRTLVGVFSVRCPPCAERVPEFLELAKNHPHGRDAVLAVVVFNGDDDPSEYRDLLNPVAHVIVEKYEGPTMRALGVKGFPALAVLDGQSRVLAAGTVLSHIEPAL
ncbi:TlpA family protein disulfide reductase [Planomonospora algeriensis]